MMKEAAEKSKSPKVNKKKISTAMAYGPKQLGSFKNPESEIQSPITSDAVNNPNLFASF